MEGRREGGTERMGEGGSVCVCVCERASAPHALVRHACVRHVGGRHTGMQHSGQAQFGRRRAKKGLQENACSIQVCGTLGRAGEVCSIEAYGTEA
eukprot:3629912-Pleurochrysis_carterae.AAC.1